MLNINLTQNIQIYIVFKLTFGYVKNLTQKF